MNFKCNNCNSSFSAAKMVGVAIGQVSKEVVTDYLGLPKNKPQNIIGREISAGILIGLGIRCPKCGESNWS